MKRRWALLPLCALATPLLAHKGRRHLEQPPPRPTALAAVNADYAKDVKPILRRKCFDCHAAAERLPWYARLPGPKQLIAHDIREARAHLDMRADFPFGGHHGTPLENLKAIEETLDEGSMPPWRYRVMHRGSRLTREEIAAIRAWIERSRALLRSP